MLYFFSKVFHVLKVDNNKVFLMSFDGTAVGYDSKAFVEWCNENGKHFRFIWGTKNRDISKKLSLKNTYFVPTKSIKGIYHMMTAKTLIYNINPPSYLSFRKEQILINTWHGFPYKVSGKYIEGFDSKQFNTTTCFLSDAEICTSTTIRDSFEYNGEVLECGTPRTDIFFSDKRYSIKERVRKKLNIPDNNYIILYAPTFRGDFNYEKSQLDINSLKAFLSKKFGGEWTVLFRLHPLIANKFKANIENVIDVSLYDDMCDLLCLADILITDYSSSNWDFSLMQKPVFIYADDLDEYKKSRGLVVPIEKWPFPLCRDNLELGNAIMNFDEESYKEKVSKYHLEMGNYDKGKSCPEVFNYIISHGGIA